MSKRKVISFRAALTPARLDREKRTLYGVQIIQAGEARGHGISHETSFVQDVVDQGNAHHPGIKARFGHPAMSSNVIGTEIGRFKNFRRQGDTAYADLHLGSYAETGPNGDLAEFIMRVAEEDPGMIMNSIVFVPGPSYQYDEDGKRVEYGEDWDNERTTYCTLEKLLASDLVDEGASTSGLFSAVNEHAFAVRLSTFLDENPDLDAFLDQHPDLEGKVTEFLEKRHKIKSFRRMQDEKKGLLKAFDELREKFIKTFSAGQPQAAPTPDPDPAPVELSREELQAQIQSLTEERDALQSGLAETERQRDAFQSQLDEQAEKLSAQSTQIEAMRKEITAFGEALEAPTLPQQRREDLPETDPATDYFSEINQRAIEKYKARQAHGLA